jgi:hypothetical protein
MGSTAPFLLLSALPHWRGATQTIAPDICIRRLSALERAVLETSDQQLLHHDLDAAARDGWWICHEFENVPPSESVAHQRRREAAFKRTLYATYAIQILQPIGAPNLSLLYRHASNSLILESTRHRPAYTGTIWAHLCDVSVPFGDHISTVLDRVQDVFQKPTLRLQIPIWLFEQGLIAADRHIRLLLWATGLDGITQSGGISAFGKRLCSLLGPDTHVFPSCAVYPLPKYKVAEVVGDLYRLRTEMAHGLPFHEKFRKKGGFLGPDDRPIADNFAGWRYDQVLEECAAFLLCRTLREILLHNRVLDVRTNSWSDSMGTSDPA